MWDEIWKWLHILAGPLIGALIGWLTNWLAVKMLFHPYTPKKIGGWKLPLTPGIIPGRRHELAAAIGRAVQGTLLTREDLTRALSAGTADRSDALRELLSQIRPADLVTEERDRQTLLRAAADRLYLKLAASLDDPAVRQILEDCVVSAVSEKLSAMPFGMFFGENAVRSLVTGQISSALLVNSEEDGENPIREYLYTQLETLSESELGTFLTEEPASAIPEEESTTIDLNATPDAAEILSALGRVGENLLATVISSCLDRVDIAGLVEARMDAMSMKELEELVLSVMKKELNAVVNLGALLGFVIGLINTVL